MDVKGLKLGLENLTFCDIEAEGTFIPSLPTVELADLREVDPNFVKMFKLSQLTIEYLLHSQVRLSLADIKLSN